MKTSIENPKYNLRRALAAGAVALAALGVWKAEELAGSLESVVAGRIHQGQEAKKLDHPLGNPYHRSSIVEGLRKEGISPSDVTIHRISSSEANPTEVAEQMHAKDVFTASEEIAGQVGGDRIMQPDEFVALANDQVKKD
ncbi:MAG TPA: hypothetical protein VNE40_04110 [Candidatus Dormibacteraeota bacterium]|nr:hypothetical protein [Candidatus Dormibacteraeota bacterium]